MTGILYGLGVGPGDPELITLKALRLLRAATVIAYPAPEQGDSLARSIIAPHLTGTPVELPIRMPFLGDPGPAQVVYDRATVEIAEHLAAGHDVALLCEGDPLFYGSFQYVYRRLASRFPVIVVPGISSPMAAAAVAGLPLTHRSDVLTVLPATLPAEDLRTRLAMADAAVIMKLGRHLAKVRTVLDALGLTASARYVERATMPGQRVLPLAELKGDTAPYFSLVLVHHPTLQPELLP